MYRRVPAALAVALLSAAPAWPQFSSEEVRAAAKNPGAFTLDEQSLRIERVGPLPPDKRKTDAIPVLDEIVNLGLKAWKIIAENKPVVDIKTQFATALPRGAKNWADMAGWRPPTGVIYDLSAKNAYGLRVVHVRYQVLRTYGGSYAGTGRYLTAVTVEPLLVEVGWGYHFAFDAAIPDKSIVNVGTSADPVAGMMVQLGWRVATPIKDSSGESVYFVQGDGGFREVAGPFAGPPLDKARGAIAKLRENAKSLD